MRFSRYFRLPGVSFVFVSSLKRAFGDGTRPRRGRSMRMEEAGTGKRRRHGHCEYGMFKNSFVREMELPSACGGGSLRAILISFLIIHPLPTTCVKAC